MEQKARGPWLERMSACDAGICLLFNRAVHRKPVERSFALVSRMGDGVFWYALMTILPLLYGKAGLVATLHMAIVGITGVLIYKVLKTGVVRNRPFVTHPSIQLGAMPLDQYSFPSGHTLHAVSFTLVASAHFPILAGVLVPFAVLVALSRMILGLHYPSDVLAGAAIGVGTAWFSMTAFLPFLPAY